MDKIKLTRGKYALVDKDDFEKVNQCSWNCLKIGYAQKNSGNKVYMHRFIMNAPKGTYVDHINGNKLDNRKSNLRLCTQSQNMANSGKKITNTSGFKGVSYDKKAKKWGVYLTFNYKHIFGGYYDDIQKAADKYVELSERYFSTFTYKK